MSRAKRVDKNQKLIVEQLRNLGFSVTLTYELGKGKPDFYIGFGKWFTLPVELKSKGGTLTKDEIKFHDEYKGYIIIAYDLIDILKGVVKFYECISGVNNTTENKIKTD